MSIQTDDFMPGTPPEKRVMSAAPASPNEEAIERARPKQFDQGQSRSR